MLKRLLLTLPQFLGFAALFYLGGYWAEIRLALELRALEHGAPPPAMIPLYKIHASPTLDYVANGLLYAAVLLVLILLGEALRRKLRPWAGYTLLAFVLAFALSLAVHSGFVPVTTP